MKYFEKLARKMNIEGEIDMEAKPSTLEDEEVYRCSIFSVHKKLIALPKKDGGREVIRREIVDHLPGVICLVHDLDTDSYLVEMEYRVGPGNFVFGLPAGLVERGEAPLETAKREVEEETGVRPGKIEEIEQYETDFVRASIRVRKHLGIASIDLLAGASTGGFQVLEWCVMEPDVIRRAAIIATDARVTPYLSAYDTAQRMALEADPSFSASASLQGGEAGLRCARAIAMISYRSYDGYNRTQPEPDADTLFAERCASYQRYQGKKLSDRFDAYSYASLIRACESNNLGRGRGGVKKALGAIQARCAVVCIDSDSLFPPQAMQLLAEGIPDAAYYEISSPFGHDGFLLENEQLSTIFTSLCKS